MEEYGLGAQCRYSVIVDIIALSFLSRRMLIFHNDSMEEFV